MVQSRISRSKTEASVMSFSGTRSTTGELVPAAATDAVSSTTSLLRLTPSTTRSTPPYLMALKPREQHPARAPHLRGAIETLDHEPWSMLTKHGTQPIAPHKLTPRAASIGCRSVMGAHVVVCSERGASFIRRSSLSSVLGPVCDVGRGHGYGAHETCFSSFAPLLWRHRCHIL